LHSTKGSASGVVLKNARPDLDVYTSETYIEWWNSSGTRLKATPPTNGVALTSATRHAFFTILFEWNAKTPDTTMESNDTKLWERSTGELISSFTQTATKKFGSSQRGEHTAMKTERIVKAKLDRDGKLRSKGRILQPRVDMSRLDSAAAFAPDKDTPILTAREVASFRRVAPKAVDPLGIRKRLKMSQTAFAHVFGVSLRTVQEWEQHRRRPAGAARTLLQVIDREPDAVRRAIGF